MIYRILPLVLLFLMSFAPKATNNVKNIETDPKMVASNVTMSMAAKIEMVYNSLNANNFAIPQMDCFKRAMEGFYALKQSGAIEKDIITIIDFSMSSTKKRLWVIDLTSNTILFNSVVSHGMKSGGEYATSFSNSQNSNKSSLGFYVTGETYIGKHGLSLKLDGQERGINHNARARAVVMHGANYANPSILRSQGYLGRSQGCPAIPESLKNQIINTVKGKSCLFIFHPSRSYEIASKLVS
ncbi:murein L,D-transpeptidase catalytic domain family protein [Flavobacterium amnicola]|uniref:Murein L,D-transpeptidase catalytic domain family protein n=1 Tax=Flavobacterium amnicola TaxID=2506422 RepID=A0A4Q1K6H9_9FLAO|nr:murein L,D-transpeptidase catalytic domain family protein [Flavobacterium amnicola]RXR21140.1 murein L,D-transpeptidase catalytic domain family protein [Flavobacterium amnicola]